MHSCTLYTGQSCVHASQTEVGRRKQADLQHFAIALRSISFNVEHLQNWPELNDNSLKVSLPVHTGVEFVQTFLLYMEEWLCK